MPFEYPPVPPTLTGDALTVSRFLADPNMVFRRMQVLAANRFVGDRVFAMPPRPAPGSIVYSPDLTVFLPKTVEAVNAGAEYPSQEVATGTATVASILKWGVRTSITDEAVGRVAGMTVGSSAGRTLIDVALAALINSIKAAVDKLAMAALDAAATNTAATVALWKTFATGDPIADTAAARAKIVKGVANVDGLFPGSGFVPDTVVCTDLNEAYARSCASIKQMMAFQNNQTASVTGNRLSLNGMEVWPSGMIPAASVTKAYVVDGQNFGFWAYENIPSPKFAGDAATGIEVLSFHDDENDRWTIKARRPVVPVAVNPTASFSISGLTE